ncbi:carboxypeptidase-like regulatory domain-containing protein [Rufibacter immobilis]|uniref:Carboxypeptidase-like regulatory domain-containing protein n=1 Tax=Rufibacter immobilis TaxID=1348778 RepID=A0A3M9N3I4_9BACT|nr:DUF5686 and carboxypeptidase-like regulatory domain-containing protein [Rufibacter immobilis]RNI31867.1 carboxypeptidase-like regulatory domain-containing protein [Rufibacter immobilis]
MYSSKNVYVSILHILVCCVAFLAAGVNFNSVQAQGITTSVRGTIKDAVSNEPLIGVSIFVPGTSLGTTSDVEGNFSLKTTQAITKIQFTYLGYKAKTIELTPGETKVLNVRLESDAKKLNEVVIKGRSRNYSNKNNPAVDLIRLVVDNKNKNRLESYDYVQYQQYDKLQLALTNTPEKLRNNILLKRYDFVTKNIDTTTLAGTAILPLYMQESLSQQYYRKDPEKKKTVVQAEKKVDFGEFVVINSYVKHMYQDIDIYKNNITILTNQFLSPIADLAPTFYRFYITDTVVVDGQKLTELSFSPKNETDFLFTGKLYVTMDGNYAVQKVDMEVGKKVNINWVRDLHINLDFDRLPNGRYNLSKSVLKSEFAVVQNSKGGVYGERTVSFKDFKINQPQPASFYEGDPLVKAEEAERHDDEYWATNRHDSLSFAEANTYQSIDSLRNTRSFKRTLDYATFLIAGYKHAGPYFEIGPVNTFYSFNPVEGFRLRVGGRTTTTFSKRVMFETYAAYGFKDEKWKYYLGGTYSFSNRSIFEFPVRALRVNYQKDTKIPGQDLQFIQEDNFLLSFKRGTNDKWLYNETYNIDYLHEFRNRFSFRVGFKNWKQTPAGSLEYLKAEGTAPAEGTTAPNGSEQIENITTSEVRLELRWAPHEEYVQGKLYRFPIVNRYPVFTLRAAAGIKGLFNGDYDYQSLTLNVTKRFYMSQLGYSDVITEGGYIFGKVPFPLLAIHRANQTYSYQIQSYNLMNFLEFVSDQYASINIDHCFNGFIFNKLPLIKKTKLREFATVKVLYGKVREENDPEVNKDLLAFPAYATGLPTTYSLDKKPYVEASLGVGNIFKFFRVDVVKRLTYLDNPGVSEVGIRGRFKFDF